MTATQTSRPVESRAVTLRRDSRFLRIDGDCHELQRLSDYGIAAPSVDTASPLREPQRLVVSSWFGLADDAMESHRLDMLLVLDARQALSERGQLALSMADARFRLWGFLKGGADVSPAQIDRLRATFGFEQTYIPQHGHTERPVQVAWVPLTSAIPEQRGASAVQWKRRHVWSPGPRNRLIARLAAAIVQGDHQYLKERAPRLACCAGQFQFERTVVLAESLQQAVAIARRLPGWPIVAGEHDSDGLDPRDAARWRVRRALLPADRPAVFTPDGLRGPNKTSVSHHKTRGPARNQRGFVRAIKSS